MHRRPVAIHHSAHICIHDCQYHYARPGKAIDQAFELQQGLLGAIAFHSEICDWDLKDAFERCWKGLAVSDLIAVRI